MDKSNWKIVFRMTGHHRSEKMHLALPGVLHLLNFEGLLVSKAHIILRFLAFSLFV